MTRRSMTNLDSLVKKFMAPVLKKNGFKKQKFVWNRQRGNYIDVVDIQLPKVSPEKCMSFTINTGIFIPAINKIIWNETLKGFAKEPNCVVRARPSDLIEDSNGLDVWWDLKSEVDVGKVGSTVECFLIEKVLPFLEVKSSGKEVYQYLENLTGWQKDYPLTKIHLALLKNSFGEKADCYRILDEIILGKNAAWAARAKSVKSAISETTAVPIGHPSIVG